MKRWSRRLRSGTEYQSPASCRSGAETEATAIEEIRGSGRRQGEGRPRPGARDRARGGGGAKDGIAFRGDAERRRGRAVRADDATRIESKSRVDVEIIEFLTAARGANASPRPPDFGFT